MRRLARYRPEIQLVAGALREQVPDGAVVEDDGERDDRLPRPAGEVVDRERQRGLQQDQLGWDLRDLLPRPEAEEREPDAGEDTRAADAAPLLAEPARRREPLVVCGEPCEPERRVGLERRCEVGLASPVDRPEPVGALAREELVRTSPGRVLVTQPQELQQEQVLGRHGHVRLELADPPAARLLQRKKAPNGAVERPVEVASSRPIRRRLRRCPRACSAHVVTLSSQCAYHGRAFPRYARTRVVGEGCPTS